MEKDVLLTYSTPDLGQLNAQLFTNSSKVYNLLDQKNHIETLKNISQLGVVINAYEGAHHSRWEYVSIQLAILHRLNTTDMDLGYKPSKSTGLSSNRVIGNSKLSHTEIIQIWILLFNIGHLPGTFSSEKAFLKCLVTDKKLRQTLNSGIKDKDIIAYSKKIINNFEIYQIHKILSVFYIKRYRKSNSDLVDFLIDVWKYYCIGAETLNKFEEYGPERQHDLIMTRNKLIDIYKRIRQISYVYLDSKYGPVPFEFNLSSILINLDKYLKDYFTENNRNFVETMDLFDDFLSKSIYQSETSLQFHAYHVKKMISLIEDKSKKQKLNGIKKLNELLLDFTFFEPKHAHIDEIKNNSKISFIINVPTIFRYSINRGYNKYFTLKYEDKLNKDYGVENCLVSIEKNITQKYYTVLVSFLKNCSFSKKYNIIGKLLRDIIKIQLLSDEGHIEIHSDEFNQIYSKLIIFCLNEITMDKCSFKYDTRNFLEQAFVGCKGSTKMASILNNIVKENNLNSSRKHELESTISALKAIDHRGPMVVSTNPIQVLDQNKDPLTDIDGIGFGFKNNKLYLLIVEAKKQKNNSITDSKRQLEDNIVNKLNLNTSLKYSILDEIIEGNKFVYCYIPIDGKKL